MSASRSVGTARHSRPAPPTSSPSQEQDSIAFAHSPKTRAPESAPKRMYPLLSKTASTTSKRSKTSTDTSSKKQEAKSNHAARKGKAAVAAHEISDHLVIQDDSDRELFCKIAAFPPALQKIRILEIVLIAKELDHFQEDQLAMALTHFHPHPNGPNPHNLEGIKIVVTGSVLFTRYAYHLVSPATSLNDKGLLNKVLWGGLNAKESANLDVKINSTEKAVAKALLEIRGVRQVVVAGRGHLEAGFEATIKATLLLAAGSPISEVRSASLEDSYATPGLDHEGEISSFERSPEEPVFDHELDEDDDISVDFASNSLSVRDMIRINKKHQDAEDLGAKKGGHVPDVSFDQESNVLDERNAGHGWFSLTGKGNTVEMGWKI